MASAELTPGLQAAGQDGANHPLAGMIPIAPAERCCSEEIEALLKDYSSVIEDVIVPKNVMYWALYWNSWPYNPKMPAKNQLGEVQRYQQLLEVIRNIVDRMLGFHLCFAGVILWSIMNIVFQVILSLVESKEPIIASEAKMGISITSFLLLSGILFMLAVWKVSAALNGALKNCLIILLIVSHLVTITRMVVPDTIGTMFLRILCLRALSEIPLVTQQSLSTGWLRKIISDCGKVGCVIFQLKMGNNDTATSSLVLPLTFGIVLYFFSLAAGFLSERADIILKKKFAVGVERLAERSLQLLLAMGRFGGKVPDKIFQVSVPQTQAAVIPRSKSLSKTHPLILKHVQKSNKPTNDSPEQSSNPDKEASDQIPESSRPLKKIASNGKILNLQMTEGISRHPSNQNIQKEREPSLSKLPELAKPKSSRPLQRKALPPLSTNQVTPKATKHVKKLTSLDVDVSPKFGPIPEESSQTYNSPINRSPIAPPPSTPSEAHPDTCLNYCEHSRPSPSLLGNSLGEYFVGIHTRCHVWLGEQPLHQFHPDDTDSIILNALTEKFTSVMQKANDANLHFSILHLLRSLGVDEHFSPQKSLGGLNAHVFNWAQEEMNFLLQRVYSDFTLVFSNLYERNTAPIQAQSGEVGAPKFGFDSSKELQQHADDDKQKQPSSLFDVNPALIKFLSMSINEPHFDNAELNFGRLELLSGSKFLIHGTYSSADARWNLFVKICRPPKLPGKSPDSGMESPGNISPIKLIAPKSLFNLPNDLSPDLNKLGRKDSKKGNTKISNIKDSVITLGAKSQDESKNPHDVTPKKSSLKHSNSSLGGPAPNVLGQGPFSKAVGALEDNKSEHFTNKAPYANRARTESVDEVYFSEFRANPNTTCNLPQHVQSFGFLGAHHDMELHTQPNSKKRVHFSESPGNFSAPKTKSHPSTPREISSPKFANEARRGDPQTGFKRTTFTFESGDNNQKPESHVVEPKPEKSPLSPQTPGTVNPVSPPTASLKNYQNNYEDIVAMVVHDMRSPLGCIIGNLELIDLELRESIQKIQNSTGPENRTPSAMGGSYAGRSHNSINITTAGLPNHPLSSLYSLLSPLIKSSKSATTLLETLVNDMLDAARISKGIFKVSNEDVDVRKVVQECLDTVGIAAKAKRLNLSYQIDGTPRIISDSQRIKQVLLNFLSNSIKFTPNNGSVRIRVEDWGGKTLRWTVEDNGEGIKPDHMKKMFEKFHSDRASRSNSKGIGLGLYICKNIIEALGPKGSISVSSEPRISTKISFDLYKDMAGKMPIEDSATSKNKKDLTPKTELLLSQRKVQEKVSSVIELEDEPKRSKLLEVKSPKLSLKNREHMTGAQTPGGATFASQKHDRTPANSNDKPSMNPALSHSQKNDIFRLTDAGVAVSKRIIEVRLRTGRNHKFSLVDGQSQYGDAQSQVERSVKSFHQYKPRSEHNGSKSRQELMNSDNPQRSAPKVVLPRAGLSDDEESHNQDENKTVHKCESIMQASINLCPTPNDSNNISRQEFNSVARKGNSNSQVDSSKIFNVLIVEDEPTLMELYGHFCARFCELKKFPVEFLQATSLEDGLRVISQVQLDVIITDFSLPDGNGLQLAREIDNYAESSRPLLILARD